MLKHVLIAVPIAAVAVAALFRVIRPAIVDGEPDASGYMVALGNDGADQVTPLPEPEPDPDPGSLLLPDIGDEKMEMRPLDIGDEQMEARPPDIGDEELVVWPPDIGG